MAPSEQANMTRRAAERGCAAAMIALGLWHREGEEGLKQAGAYTRSLFQLNLSHV